MHTNYSLISKETIVIGDIKATSKILILGEVQGNIISTNTCIIDGKIVGNITAKNIYISTGQIDGNINAEQIFCSNIKDKVTGIVKGTVLPYKQLLG